jgi:hypothetical protein
MELELGCVPNSTTCSTNSTVKLLYGGVDGAELQKQERSSPIHPLVFFCDSTPLVLGIFDSTNTVALL